MVKANFFRAIAAGIALWRVAKYIGNQRRLIEQWDYKVRSFRLVGFAGGELRFNLDFELDNRSGASMSAGLFDFDVFVDGVKIGRAISNDFVDIQPYSRSSVNFDLRVRVKDLGAAGQKFIKAIDQVGKIKIKLVGQFSMQTLPGMYKTVPVNYEDSVSNLFFGE